MGEVCTLVLFILLQYSQLHDVVHGFTCEPLLAVEAKEVPDEHSGEGRSSSSSFATPEEAHTTISNQFR